MPSIQAAISHFSVFIMPRRVRDPIAEQYHQEKTGSFQYIYRRVLFEDTERGEPYPYFNDIFSSMSHFGVGIGVYFLQLLSLPVIYIIAGMVLIPMLMAYSAPSYAHASENLMSQNYALRVSAACSNLRNVSVVNCEDLLTDSNCTATINEHCDLPLSAAACDLVMSVVLIIGIYASSLIENNFASKLDDSVQTAADYALQVNDPPGDATDPDEWYKFFSRYGQVKSISVIKDTATICSLLVEKLTLSVAAGLGVPWTMKGSGYSLQHSLQHSHLQNQVLASKQVPLTYWEYWLFQIGIYATRNLMLRRLAQVQNELDLEFKKTSKAVRIMVIFEHEEAKILAHSSLEVPDLYAALDLRIGVADRDTFRNASVLDIQEPAEPDCVIWENLHRSRASRRMSAIVAETVLIAVGVILFIVFYESRNQTFYLPFIIGAIDSVMPALCDLLTDYERHVELGHREKALQIKLFLCRMLTSTLFPYANSDWKEAITVQHVSAVFNIQVAACFTTTLINAMDLYGMLTRNVFAPLVSYSQEQLNANYAGTWWSLAARYTTLSNIVMVTLFYSLLNPVGFLTAILAFLLIFAVDRFLLLRRWAPAPLLDLSVARKLRFQVLICVGLHMYATLRYIYSWPMDTAMKLDGETGLYLAVDKYPGLIPWQLSVREWMSPSQATIFPIYQTATLAVLALALCLVVIIPLFFFLRRMLTKRIRSESSSGIPFSAVPRIFSYVPMTTLGKTKLVTADVSRVAPEHVPSVPHSADDFDVNLSLLVPSNVRKYVMSEVKEYPVGDEVDEEATVVNSNPPKHKSMLESTDEKSNKAQSDKSGPKLTKTGGYLVEAETLEIIKGKPVLMSARQLRQQQEILFAAGLAPAPRPPVPNASDKRMPPAALIAPNDTNSAEPVPEQMAKVSSGRGLQLGLSLGLGAWNTKYAAIEPVIVSSEIEIATTVSKGSAPPGSIPENKSKSDSPTSTKVSTTDHAVQQSDGKQDIELTVSPHVSDVSENHVEVPEFAKDEFDLLAKLRREILRCSARAARGLSSSRESFPAKSTPARLPPLQSTTLGSSSNAFQLNVGGERLMSFTEFYDLLLHTANAVLVEFDGIDTIHESLATTNVPARLELADSENYNPQQRRSRSQGLSQPSKQEIKAASRLRSKSRTAIRRLFVKLLSVQDALFHNAWMKRVHLHKQKYFAHLLPTKEESELVEALQDHLSYRLWEHFIQHGLWIWSTETH